MATDDDEDGAVRGGQDNAGSAECATGTRQIVRVVLAGDSPARLSPLLARDVEQAMSDLAHENSFQPRWPSGTAVGARGAGPFVLHLSVQNGRLVLDIRDADDAMLHVVALALGPFRRLIKDYLMLVDSHAMAAEEGREQRMEAIDMGRRGLHNEGATLMVERLAGKVEINFETARRLFTLVCVLSQRL